MKKYYLYIGGVALITTGVLLLSWRKKAANTAANYLDIAEVGNNQGFTDKAFQAMLAQLGWVSGEAWCMFFAKFVYMNAFPKKAAKIDAVLNGSTQQSWAAAQAHPELFKVISNGKPKKGDIIIFQSTSNSSLGHAAIAYHHESGDDWTTVEGNTSFDGSNGQGVANKTRTLVPGNVSGGLKVLGFIRMKLI